MSYSLKCDCYNCKKQDECVDSAIVQGAIYGIHGINAWSTKQNKQVNKGHKGAGQIVIECSLIEKIGE